MVVVQASATVQQLSDAEAQLHVAVIQSCEMQGCVLYPESQLEHDMMYHVKQRQNVHMKMRLLKGNLGYSPT